MRNLLKQHGYLFIDHSNSPGVPAEMARQAGIDPALVAEGRKLEVDTLCCAHCKGHVIPHPKRPHSDRATCPKCDHHFICDFCAFQAQQPEYSHAPYERRVDLVLSGKPDPLGSPRVLLKP